MGYGAFNNGATTGTQYADPYASYDPINGMNVQYTASRYTVREGDTLQSIALALWGDSSFWWMIADVNGLNGGEALQAGFSLIIPNKIHNSHNNSETFKVFNPNELIGDTSPTAAPKPPKPKNKDCGILGQIFLVVIAVVVSLATAGALSGPMTALATSMGFSASAAAVAGTVMAGAIGGAVGSIVSQGIGVATGLQDKFSWNAVALAAIGGGIGGGVGPKGLNLFGGMTDTIGKFGVRFLQGAVTSAVTQGIGVASGMQDRFSWGGVAASGLANGVGGWMGDKLAGVQFSSNTDVDAFAHDFVSGMAGGVAGAAALSLIEGSDFGDNLVAMLPGVIGNTVGNALIRGISGIPSRHSDRMVEGDDPIGEMIAATGAWEDAGEGGGYGGLKYFVDPGYAEGGRLGDNRGTGGGWQMNPSFNTAQNGDTLQTFEDGTVVVTGEDLPWWEVTVNHIADFFTYRGGSSTAGGNQTSYYELGWQYFTGIGPRQQVFGQSDPATQILRNDPNLTRMRAEIATGKFAVGKEGRWDNNLGGLKNALVFTQQYVSLATGGQGANLADTYLGSYNADFKIIDVDDQGVTTASVHVYNTSDMSSLTHPPIIGYTPWWQRNAEPLVQKYLQPSSGPLSPTRQDFYWVERIPTK